MEKELWLAASFGEEDKVTNILLDNPGINVNWKNEKHFNRTALHRACERGYDKMVALLSAHPAIDVNQKEIHGLTPFISACGHQNTECVRVMLGDARVKVNEPSNDGETPLANTAYNGSLEIIKSWIASGREIDLGYTDRPAGNAIAVAKEFERHEVVSLLEKFKEDPRKTRFQLRVELGLFDAAAAEIFALVIFLCDGLLDHQRQTSTGTDRFFQIARRLPIEIQMILCYRVVGSTRGNIPGDEREIGFRNLSCDFLS